MNLQGMAWKWLATELDRTADDAAGAQRVAVLAAEARQDIATVAKWAAFAQERGAKLEILVAAVRRQSGVC